MIDFDPNKSDPEAVALAKAIKMKETKGQANPFTAIGDNGTSFGAGQWQKPTWEQHSKEVFGSVQPMTQENQQKVLYGIAKLKKDQGYTPEEIFAEWNSGNRKNITGHKGVSYRNGKPLYYDTEAYVKEASQYFNEFRGQRQQPNDNFVVSTLKDVAHPFERALQGIGDYLSPEQEDPGFFRGGITGDIQDKYGYNKGQKITGLQEAGQVAGDVLQIGANFIPAGAVAGTVGRAAFPTIKKLLLQGAITGGAYGLGSSLSNDVDADLTDRAVQTIIGAGLTGLGTVALGSGAKYATQAIANRIDRAAVKAGIQELNSVMAGMNPTQKAAFLETPQAANIINSKNIFTGNTMKDAESKAIQTFREFVAGSSKAAGEKIDNFTDDEVKFTLQNIQKEFKDGTFDHNATRVKLNEDEEKLLPFYGEVKKQIEQDPLNPLNDIGPEDFLDRFKKWAQQKTPQGVAPQDLFESKDIEAAMKYFADELRTNNRGKVKFGTILDTRTKANKKYKETPAGTAKEDKYLLAGNFIRSLIKDATEAYPSPTNKALAMIDDEYAKIQSAQKIVKIIGGKGAGRGGFLNNIGAFVGLGLTGGGNVLGPVGFAAGGALGNALSGRLRERATRRLIPDQIFKKLMIDRKPIIDAMLEDGGKAILQSLETLDKAKRDVAVKNIVNTLSKANSPKEISAAIKFFSQLWHLNDPRFNELKSKYQVKLAYLQRLENKEARRKAYQELINEPYEEVVPTIKTKIEGNQPDNTPAQRAKIDLERTSEGLPVVDDTPPNVATNKGVMDALKTRQDFIKERTYTTPDELPVVNTTQKGNNPLNTKAQQAKDKMKRTGKDLPTILSAVGAILGAGTLIGAPEQTEALTIDTQENDGLNPIQRMTASEPVEVTAEVTDPSKVYPKQKLSQDDIQKLTAMMFVEAGGKNQREIEKQAQKILSVLMNRKELGKDNWKNKTLAQLVDSKEFDGLRMKETKGDYNRILNKKYTEADNIKLQPISWAINKLIAGELPRETTDTFYSHINGDMKTYADNETQMKEMRQSRRKENLMDLLVKKNFATNSR